MKQEKGITTTSVIIYVIAVLIVISTLSTLSIYFNKQIKEGMKKQENNSTYATFASYFVQDIQEKGNEVVRADTEQEINYIEFSNGNIYKYSQNDKTLYKNDVKICDNIDSCSFSYTLDIDNRKLIEIQFVSGEFRKIGNNSLKFYMNTY